MVGSLDAVSRLMVWEVVRMQVSRFRVGCSAEVGTFRLYRSRLGNRRKRGHRKRAAVESGWCTEFVRT